MNFEQELHTKCVIFRPLDQRVDALVAPDFRTSVIQLASDNQLTVLIDLVNVDFMDSSGLGALIGCFKAVQDNGGLVLSNVHDNVKELLALTHMDRIFEIYDDPGDFLQQDAA